MHRLLREAEKLHAVDAEQPPDEIRAVRRAVDERHGRALHERVRVRVEGHNGTFDTERFGALDRAVQKRRVAAVYAVKNPRARTHFLSAMNDQTSKTFYRNGLAVHDAPDGEKFAVFGIKARLSVRRVGPERISAAAALFLRGGERQRRRRGKRACPLGEADRGRRA